MWVCGVVGIEQSKESNDRGSLNSILHLLQNSGQEMGQGRPREHCGGYGGQEWHRIGGTEDISTFFCLQLEFQCFHFVIICV